MYKRAILHLVNNLADSSIMRIVEQIIRCSGTKEYSWYVGSLKGSGVMAKSLQDAGVGIFDYSASAKLKSLTADLQKYDIQIVHTHTPRTTVTAFRALLNLPSDHRPKHITTKHLLTRPSDRSWGFIYSGIDYFSLYFPDFLVPVSLTMGKQLSRLPFMSGYKILPIPNGIQFEQYSNCSDREIARGEFAFPQNATVFGYAGRLDSVKRLDILLSAFQRVYTKHPYARLLILGDGQMKPKWQVASTNLGLEKVVVWAGYRSDMPRMMAAMDVYVQPSDNEGLSLSILEAMAARRPVISTKVGAALEVITHGKTGCLIEPGSMDQLAEAMNRSIVQPELFRMMAQAASNHVQKKYSVRAMVDSYQELYRTITRDNRHG